MAMLILLVDDDADDREIFCDALQEIDENISCLVAKDGAEAISILKELIVLPDIIFLDINMPLINGKEILRSIKAHSKFKGVPIIMFTTSSTPGDRAESIKLGAKEYVVKPSAFNELVELLRKILSNH